jgi:hypothetical protein
LADPASTVATKGNARNGEAVPGASSHLMQFTPIERPCQYGNEGQPKNLAEAAVRGPSQDNGPLSSHV